MPFGKFPGMTSSLELLTRLHLLETKFLTLRAFIGFDAICQVGTVPIVDLYLNRRLRSKVIHDLNTVIYCT
jgi:hypothetical protein